MWSALHHILNKDRLPVTVKLVSGHLESDDGKGFYPGDVVTFLQTGTKFYVSPDENGAIERQLGVNRLMSSFFVADQEQLNNIAIELKNIDVKYCGYGTYRCTVDTFGTLKDYTYKITQGTKVVKIGEEADQVHLRIQFQGDLVSMPREKFIRTMSKCNRQFVDGSVTNMFRNMTGYVYIPETERHCRAMIVAKYDDIEPLDMSDGMSLVHGVTCLPLVHQQTENILVEDMSPDVFTYMSACFAVEMGVDEDSFTVYDVLCKTKVQQHSKEEDESEDDDDHYLTPIPPHMDGGNTNRYVDRDDVDRQTCPATGVSDEDDDDNYDECDVGGDDSSSQDSDDGKHVYFNVEKFKTLVNIKSKCEHDIVYDSYGAPAEEQPDMNIDIRPDMTILSDRPNACTKDILADERNKRMQGWTATPTTSDRHKKPLGTPTGVQGALSTVHETVNTLSMASTYIGTNSSEGGSLDKTLPPIGGAVAKSISPIGGAMDKTISPIDGATDKTISPIGGAMDKTISPIGGARPRPQVRRSASIQPPPVAPKPSVKRINSARWEHNTSSQSDVNVRDRFEAVREISKMTVTEVILFLEQYRMTGLADVCREHLIDGSFLADLNDIELSTEPFCLSPFKIKQFTRLKQGILPKI